MQEAIYEVSYNGRIIAYFPSIAKAEDYITEQGLGDYADIMEIVIAVEDIIPVSRNETKGERKNE